MQHTEKKHYNKQNSPKEFIRNWKRKTLQDLLVKKYGKSLKAIFKLVCLKFDCCFVWVWNLDFDIAGGREAEGVWEHGVEVNSWT